MRYTVKPHACQLSPRSDRPPLRIAVDGHVGASLMVMRQEAVSFRIGVLWPSEFIRPVTGAESASSAT